MWIRKEVIRVWATFALVTIGVSNATAVPPGYVSDRSLAESPVVVVAKWDGAPWVNNSLVEGNALKEHEVRTEIVVERVIKGELSVGKHDTLVGFRIGWSKERPWVTSYMSTQAFGDAAATRSNLWFLQRKRSRIEKDTTDYLYLPSYRGVQPLALEPYFEALASEHPTSQVATLLQSDNETVVRRTLEWVAGHDPPWPYEPWRFVRPKSKEAALPEFADAVHSLVQRTDSKEVRRFALAVYAHVEGEDSRSFMQQHLTADDPSLRAIAIGSLAGENVIVANDLMAKAAVGIDDPVLACEVIERLHEWNDLEAVPVLIPFLQTDGLSYRTGNDLGIPAIKAQEALKHITGYEFPFDVAASEKAWSTAREIEDSNEQVRHLTEVLPNHPSPWNARAFRQEGRVRLQIVNTSDMQLSLGRNPTNAGVTHSSGVFGVFDGPEPDGPDSFVQVEPGASIELSFDLPEFVGVPTDELDLDGATINVQFHRNGREFGVNAWLGVVTARVNNGE